MIELARAAVEEHKAVQKPEELAELLGLLVRETPRHVLEIGSAWGGTLWAWRQIANATVVSVDVDHGRLAESNRDGVTLITGDSHDDATLDRVRDIAATLDFVFIDGDHSLEGVHADFEMYGPLVRTGGIIAIHDIVTESCPVSEFWKAVRPHHLTLEIIASADAWSAPSVSTANEKWAGIGVVRVT